MSNIFEFKNQNGDIVKLVKSTEPSDSLQFINNNAIVLNQNRTIKRDTVVYFTTNKYHCYIQVNPTSFKVYKSSYNDDGLEVENLYFDNIVNVNIFSGTNRLFSKDFRKDDFKGLVPKPILKQCVLSDIKLQNVDKKGFSFQAQLAIPDSPSSYLIEITISFTGKLKKNIDAN